MTRPSCHAVAITGAIASGKSRCARHLSNRFGLAVIDADTIGRQLIEPGSATYDRLRALLPKRFFQDNGTLDRRRLRAAIFADHDLRLRLERLLHPAIRNVIRQRLAATPSPCLVEVPLLFEAGWQEDFDRVVVVYACAAQRFRRLQERDRLDERQALAAQAAQARPTLERKALAADHVIDNSGPWSATLLELDRLGQALGWNAPGWPGKEDKTP